MNQSKPSDNLQIEQWATRQLADFDARQPGTIFAEGVVLSVAEGYALQAAVVRLRCLRGEQVVGYKVGCTSSRIREQLGIDHCVTGRLFDTERHSSGAVLSRKDFANLAIEGELAVELSREPTASDFSEGEIPACVARVFPVIELHHHVMRCQPPSAGELIAHNAIHAGFVAGSGSGTEVPLGEPSLTIHAEGRLLDECAGTELIDTIHSSLKWLMEIMQSRGEQLVSGQIVLTGSIPSLTPVTRDGILRVDAPPFGGVEVKFIACPPFPTGA
jgi:2-keto-4-pentenoate hydratase